MVDPTCEIHMVHYKVCFMVKTLNWMITKKCMKKESPNSSSKTFDG
jgi:hypothetical protein